MYEFSKTQKILIGVAVVVVLLIWIVASSVGILNTEARALNRFKAQQDIVVDYADKAWKIVQQKAQVQEKYAEDFKAVYIESADARYGEDQQQLMKWITEHNPNLDSTVYKELMVTIESQREDLQSQQTRLHDLELQHNTPFDVFPSNVVLSVAGREKVDSITVISSRTQKTFANDGVEDDIAVY